jgi:acetate---CoA ligase (ADP-forming)
MSTTSELLHSALNPTSIAIVGVSESSTWSRGILNNLQAWSFPGNVYFVNPNREEVFGQPCYPSVHEVPVKIEHVLILVRASLVPNVLEDCVRAGVSGATVIAAGFEEAGEEGQRIARHVVDICEKGQLALIGPNTAGWLNPGRRTMILSTGFEREPKGGPLAIVCQSGGVTMAAYLAAQAHGTNTSYVVGSGNETVTTMVDYFEYFLKQPEIKVLGGVVETVRDPTRFAAMAEKALAVDKPIVLLKFGRSDVARQRAIAHTGGIAGTDEVVEEYLKDLGVIRVSSLAELAETAGLLASGARPRGRRTVYIGGSGGAGAMFSDEVLGNGLELATLDEALTREVGRLIGQPESSVMNPIDLTTEALDQVHPVAQLMVDSGVADIVVIEGDAPILVRNGGGEDVSQMWPPLTTREKLAATFRDSGVIGVNMSTSGRDPSFHGLEVRRPLECLHSVEGIAALAHAAWYVDARSRRERSNVAELEVTSDVHDYGVGVFDEVQSKQFLASYGASIAREQVAHSSREASAAAVAIGFPVVMKIVSRDLPHKSEIGGVRLNVNSADEAERVFDEIMASAAKNRPDAQLSGVLVGEQIQDGAEFYVGMIYDEQYGPVLVIGTGGVYVEVLKDVVLSRVPISPSRAEDLVRELRGFAFLDGARGRPKLDVRGFAEFISRVSHLVNDNVGRVLELDINPVIVRPTGAIVVDALIVATGG